MGMLSQKAAASGLRHCGRARCNTQFVQDVCQMTMNRVIAHEEPLGDRLIIQAFGYQAQDLDLTLG
jgi:hypothetical protein